MEGLLVLAACLLGYAVGATTVFLAFKSVPIKREQSVIKRKEREPPSFKNLNFRNDGLSWEQFEKELASLLSYDGTPQPEEDINAEN